MLHQSPITPQSRVRLPAEAAAVSRERFVFLLLDGFNHPALANALEPLRIANRLCPGQPYRWQIVTPSGDPAVAADGLTVLADGRLEPLGRAETLFVVGGEESRAAVSEPVIAFLRRQKAHGTRIGALCQGVYALAMAGLLDGRDCAVHWNALEGFAEEFPAARPARVAFTAGCLPTAPGSAVAADLMLHLIAETRGAALATRIADEMIASGIRTPASQQTVSLQSRYGIRHPRLVKVLQAMERNLEQPLSAQDIAEIAGMSVRQTERLFARHLKVAPMTFYMRLRLDRARNLLMQTELSVTEVAIACGFRSLSHFAKTYRAAHGVSPRNMRAVAG